MNQVSGASRAFCEVGKRIADRDEIQFAYLFSENIFLKEIFGRYRPFLPNIEFKGKNFLNNKMQEFYCRRIISANDYDVFHSTGEGIYFKKNKSKPFVTTFHDMIPERFLNKSPRLKNRKTLTVIADRIVCVSENSRKELLEFYTDLNPDKVDVVYHGIDNNNIVYNENLYGEYILFVGVRTGYKNFLQAINSIIPLLRQHCDLKIVCTGATLSTEEIEFISKHKLDGRIISVGYVSNNCLFSLYRHALLFIFPSLYEGFGIPILEAFVNECPACVSETSCFPEIGGDAVSYFNPRREDSILESVTKVLEDRSFAKKLVINGKERVKHFTWEKSAESMLSVYKKSLK